MQDFNLNWNKARPRKRPAFSQRLSRDRTFDLGRVRRDAEREENVIQALWATALVTSRQVPLCDLLGDESSGSTSDGRVVEISTGTVGQIIRRVLFTHLLYEGPEFGRKRTRGIVRVAVGFRAGRKSSKSVWMKRVRTSGSMCCSWFGRHHNRSSAASPRRVTLLQCIGWDKQLPGGGGGGTGDSAGPRPVINRSALSNFFRTAGRVKVFWNGWRLDRPANSSRAPPVLSRCTGADSTLVPSMASSKGG